MVVRVRVRVRVRGRVTVRVRVRDLDTYSHRLNNFTASNAYLDPIAIYEYIYIYICYMQIIDPYDNV